MDERIALVTPLSDEEVGEVIVGEQAMVDALIAGGVELTPDGERQIDAGAFGLSRAAIDELALDPFHLVASGLAAELVVAGAIVVPDDATEVFVHTSELRRRIDTTTTVGVFVGPN
jgi:hypothetical protein